MSNANAAVDGTSAQTFHRIFSELVYCGLLVKRESNDLAVPRMALAEERDLTEMRTLDASQRQGNLTILAAARAFCDKQAASLAQLAQGLEDECQKVCVVKLTERLLAGVENTATPGMDVSADFWTEVQGLASQIRSPYFILDMAAYGFIAFAWHERSCASAPKG